jgi:methylenetetrahydrofolate--tRNA-(uracil-5-)-methyltransferase
MQEFEPMSQKKPLISVVGGGLAGSETALQLAHNGFKVDLYEMRPQKQTPAHKSGNLAELVCSNSFGSTAPQGAPGLLKIEAEKLGSHILKAAKIAQVPAGQALGIDREIFAQTVTDWVRQHPNITVHSQEIESLEDLPRPAVIATGPLTSEPLAASIQKHFGGEFLYFFDAIAPVIDADSIDRNIVWAADRYDKGTPDYLNCPFTKEQYFQFIDEISRARKIEPKDFEKTPFFEGCMPIEVMIERGPHTLRFGPMKPVGLIDPKTGREAYAVVQLRTENKDFTAYNMVGFQTAWLMVNSKEFLK